MGKIRFEILGTHPLPEEKPADGKAPCEPEETARFFSDAQPYRRPDGRPNKRPDGRPFAPEAATRKKPGAPHAAGKVPFDNAFTIARTLVSINMLSQALDVLEAARGGSPSANLRLRLFQLRLLRENGKCEEALALAKTLLRETAARDLHTWDSQLALKALLAARGVFMLNTAGCEQELRELRRLLAQLSPAMLD